jgi:ubiquinone/menaquinone biosynthesis C-methylase UbiE
MAGHPIFATIYDRLMAANEKDGLGEMRADLLRSAAGRALEIGAGTGANLEFYPDAVTELVLSEPDPHMAKRLRARVAETPRATGTVEVVEAGAEQLPFDDGGFDTVISTLALCTVAAPERAVAEARRVLKPGGRLLFIEHVRDKEGSRRTRWQDRLERPWGWISGGCHPNRDTGRLLSGAFEELELNDVEFPGSVPPLVKPMIVGSARRQA